MKYAFTVLVPMKLTSMGGENHYRQETHILTGYTGVHAAVNAEGALRRNLVSTHGSCIISRATAIEDGPTDV